MPQTHLCVVTHNSPVPAYSLRLSHHSSLCFTGPEDIRFFLLVQDGLDSFPTLVACLATLITEEQTFKCVKPAY